MDKIEIIKRELVSIEDFFESKKDDDKYLSTKIEDKIRNKITYKVSDDSTWTKEHFINIYNKNENEE